ncbi:hypothetical protein GIB67_028791 [Kingdonia uniflora]|uniref:Uncharacterized protein n=1 Tax=Kingdonia uniflora TaxID=39325 RepID=A0A7J7MMI6_9MAGN|nr:hypothetical protein GIB67_028791 [Kingdonia uniflora]
MLCMNFLNLIQIGASFGLCMNFFNLITLQHPFMFDYFKNLWFMEQVQYMIDTYGTCNGQIP